MFINDLLAWFQEVREPYFFREQRNPYRVWVSEVALQQTRIQAALKPLQRFFEAFPDISSLAQATEEEVLYAFRGLGYYSRARNLRKGAIYIKEKHQGELPSDYTSLLSVPSIGPYTAAAISSICFRERRPVCDGNVKRVLARFQMWSDPKSGGKLAEKSTSFLGEIFSQMQAHPGDVNEAIMELGQKICVRSRPLCPVCPIAQNCQAWQNQVVNQYPAASPKPEKIPVRWNMYFIHNSQDKILMQNWKDFYFLKGHYSFPSSLDFLSQKKHLFSWEGKNLEKNLLWQKKIHKKLTPLFVQKHGITKHKIEIYSYFLSPADFPSYFHENDDFLWVSQEEVSSRLVASALSKVWTKYLESSQMNF